MAAVQTIAATMVAIALIVDLGVQLFVAVSSPAEATADATMMRTPSAGTSTLSLNTNLTVTGGRIVVDGGRLRNEKFRIRVTP